MKKHKIVLAALLLVVCSQSLFADEQMLSNLPSHVQQTFSSIISGFYDPIKKPAMWLFVTLASIQMTLTFGFMFLRGEIELGGVMATLIRFILIFGLFEAFFDHPEWMKDIFNGFTALADRATHGKVTSLDRVLENIEFMWLDIWEHLKKNKWYAIADSLSVVGIGIIETIVIALLIGYALMTYGFFIFSLYVGVFWLGFASFDYTRAWAINSVVNIIRWGAKWFMQLLIIAVTFQIVDKAFGADTLYDYITLVIVSLIMLTISFGSNSFVDSYFNGHGGGDNNLGVQMAQSFLSNTANNITNGAREGAKAGYSAVKEAAAAGGNGSGSKISKAARAVAGATVGAAAGMTSGTIKSFTGSSGANTGQRSGTAAAKMANAGINGTTKLAQGAANLAKKAGGKSSSQSVNKDRTGFDLNQLSSGEIKGA